MQKQTIYSYLQRSLVKIVSKSTYANKYKTTLVKPLNTCSTSITGSAQLIKNSKKLIPLSTQVVLQSQTLHFFKKVNTSFILFLRALGHVGHQPSLSFICKLELISFIRPRFGALIFSYDRSLLARFYGQKKSQATPEKLIKLNQSLNNAQLLYYFIGKLLDTHFCSETLCSNKKMVACFLSFPCPKRFWCSTCCVLWQTAWCPCWRFSCTKGTQKSAQKGTSYPLGFANPSDFWVYYSKDNKGSPFRQGAFNERLPKEAFTAKEAPKSKAFLWANPFDTRLDKAPTNFYFCHKQSQLFFFQRFYKRKDKSQHYRKTFHNLFYFFSFFYFTTNKEVSFFKNIELVAAKQISFTRYAQQLLYLHKIEGVTSCFQLLCLTSTDRDSLDFLRNKITITSACPKVDFITNKHIMQCFSFPLFYYAIKYIKQFKRLFSTLKKKQADDPFQTVLIKNNSIDQFNKIVDFNFISFKPFFRKLVSAYGQRLASLKRASSSAFNSHYFFLMRPFFSLTRLDTFFICESLKLPIYPDKSNLRVDFLRNRIRKQILPAIRILLNPQFDTILCKFYE